MDVGTSNPFRSVGKTIVADESMCAEWGEYLSSTALVNMWQESPPSSRLRSPFSRIEAETLSAERVRFPVDHGLLAAFWFAVEAGRTLLSLIRTYNATFMRCPPSRRLVLVSHRGFSNSG